jgi:hypothetical protein
MIFRILIAIDALVGAVLLYFFFAGVEDGSVSSFNILLWLAILGGMALVIGFGLTLARKGQRLAANLVLLVPALPGLFFGLFVLAAILLHPRWN